MSGSLTDQHYDWAARFCGIDIRASGQPADSQPDLSTESGLNSCGDPGASQQEGPPGAQVLAAASMAGPAITTPNSPPMMPGTPTDPGVYELPPIQQPSPNGSIGPSTPAAETGAETGAEVAGAEEEIETATALLPEEAEIPMVGWIALGATILFIGYVAYKAYVVDKGGKPVRPATPQEEQQAKENEGKPVPTAQDPQSGQPLYTPADGDYSPATDPATGQPFPAPGQSGAQEPAQASSEDDDLDRHDHEDYAEQVLSEGPGVDCDQLTEAISGLIEALRERALQMEDPKRTDRRTYQGHKQRYEKARDMLKKLVDIADGREDCGINTGEAKDWIKQDPPPPQ